VSEKDLRPLQFIPFYLLWIVSGALTIITGLVARQAITAVTAALGEAVPMEWQIEREWFTRWIVRAVDPFAIAILSVLAFSTIIALDYLYRNAILKKTVKKTFGIVTAVQLGILIVSIIAITIVSSTGGV
jgi:hypothetical protein